MSDHDDDPRDDATPDDRSTGPGAGAADGEADDARVAEGVEHLQRAAREMIAAARTFLDVVEDVVGDNAAVASVADAFGSWSQAMSRMAGRSGEAGDAAEGGEAGEDDGRSRVQHIDLS